MLIRTALGATLLGVGLSLTSFSAAQALTMKECSAKYQDAQKANTLNGMKWNDFRKAQCGSEATATPAAATAPAAPAAPAAAPANPLKPAPAVAPAAPKPAAAPAAAGAAVFPKGIDPKYSTLSAGKGRQKTCVDQYNANKATNSNGGMKWIEKGGGYWSACDKALKGA
jgi:pyruvate/2-oxoglutarate dehydrogenase complex dihydrolipoamide acyltransferase (E2) component